VSAPVDVALVTGAAGSIGRATIAALAGRGLAVATADRKPVPEPEAGLVALSLEVDLTDDDACAPAFERLAGAGALRHVVAVAGGGDVEELAQPDPAIEPAHVFTRVVANNLGTAFATIRHAVPLLRRTSGDRSITLVGSINAYGGYGAPGYSAAKAGLSGLVNALATPLGADGIRINCLALGTVDTANLHALAEARGETLDLAAIAAKAPLERVLAPADVASALVAMALEMAGLTGATIVLDNGQTHIR
jgi:NAD(P)-dependent dehydrogenase (short-subunit alcohol dehydrogenase family)